MRRPLGSDTGCEAERYEDAPQEVVWRAEHAETIPNPGGPRVFEAGASPTARPAPDGAAAALRYAAHMTRSPLLAAVLVATGALHAQSDPPGVVTAAVRTWLKQPAAARAAKIPDFDLREADSARVVEMVFDRLRREARAARRAELAAVDGGRRKPTRLLTVQAAGQKMKLYERTFGKAPDAGHSLWISMHGGGGAPARVNDGQWNNQIELYQPEEGIYVAPRAPTNTWNLWHQGHIDDLFDRLIENYVVDRGVDPNRVYLLGYSAGGDGVYQLAPRMADRFAAVSMMAGHPNGVPMDGVRNLPFMIWMGANDGAYKRNEQAAAYGAKLDALAKEDPGGYVHETHIDADDLAWVEGTPDWMPLSEIDGVARVPSRRKSTSSRKILPAFLLAWFVGVFGIHRFYAGRVGSGIAMLVLTITIFGIFITAIWSLVDLIILACGSFRDGDGVVMKEWT